MGPLKYILVLGIATTLDFAGLQEEETIEWTPESKLTWKDLRERRQVMLGQLQSQQVELVMSFQLVLRVTK